MSTPILCFHVDVPDLTTGTGFVVMQDHQHLLKLVDPSRLLIACNARNRSLVGDGQIHIPKRSKRDPNRLLRFLIGRYPSVCPTYRDLRPLAEHTFRKDIAFCGDTILYPALRALLPEGRLVVRFHNYFTDVLNHAKDYGYLKSMPLYYIELLRFRNLEHTILRDPKALPVFLCREEAESAYRATRRTGSVRTVAPTQVTRPHDRPLKTLVWFGGLTAHKFLSMRRFLSDHWPAIRHANPGVELHLYGLHTEKFSAEGVTGHGRYPGTDFPKVESALYINPDLVGGGVKIKMLHYMMNGIPFISTPVGTQGIEVPSNLRWRVEPMSEWPRTIAALLQPETDSSLP